MPKICELCGHSHVDGTKEVPVCVKLLFDNGIRYCNCPGVEPSEE